MKKCFFSILPALLIVFVPVTASAHIVASNDLTSGFTHPLFGIDHLLAMVAVGVLSMLLGIARVWQLPAIFVGFMILGGITGINALPIIGVEQSIALSVIFFGLLIARSQHMPYVLALCTTALFGFMHGYAHGAEMPIVAQPVFFSFGFVLSTLLLHISGVLIGKMSLRSQITHTILRLGGGGMTIAGMLFLFAL
ncbi:MAG: HupE/UreJ family protein [Candidatus Kerfeldbacteria bacterium]|nr:HupE/UreJ family protein [Candidatus Kerfeldbacteria bacterium]